MKKIQAGFIYIMSNNEYPGKLKIGKTKDEPVIRAKSLSNQTSAIGKFKVEWQIKVPDMNIAESILHYKFRKLHYTKEFFEIDLEQAKILSQEIIEDFFNSEIEPLESQQQLIRIKKLIAEHRK